MRMRRIGSVTAVAVASLVLTTAGITAATAAQTDTSTLQTDISVAQYLRQTMDRLGFQQVLDLAPIDSAQFQALNTGPDKEATTPAQRVRQYAANADPKPISQQPQIDATVLELDDHGRIVSSGTVLMSPQYVHGVVVPVDRNHHTTAVRWRQWEDEGWYTNHGKGTIDVVPGREAAPPTGTRRPSATGSDDLTAPGRRDRRVSRLYSRKAI